MTSDPFHKEMEQYLNERKKDRTPLHQKVQRRVKETVRSNLAGKKDAAVQQDAQVEIIAKERSFTEKWLDAIREFLHCEEEDRIVDSLEAQEAAPEKGKSKETKAEGEEGASPAQDQEEAEEESRQSFFGRIFGRLFGQGRYEEVDEERLQGMIETAEEEEKITVAQKVVLLKSPAEKDIPVALAMVEELLAKMREDERSAFMKTEQYGRYVKLKEKYTGKPVGTEKA
ncbi:hypothetical protein COY95_00105 [Candidatus Woesearchaeota archaeon CG_4_10_14_0_8_um_filter_47_5]|nr:MAG: hypothetical protein COY95_00105 [Candidatus Woesearchaeota archaeon CG_4_10_14_0_8_um_filter_47_5]